MEEKGVRAEEVVREGRCGGKGIKSMGWGGSHGPCSQEVVAVTPTHTITTLLAHKHDNYTHLTSPPSEVPTHRTECYT